MIRRIVLLPDQQEVGRQQGLDALRRGPRASLQAVQRGASGQRPQAQQADGKAGGGGAHAPYYAPPARVKKWPLGERPLTFEKIEISA
ncbi:hypothetical protein D3C84_1165960 [compost metagenome]